MGRERKGGGREWGESMSQVARLPQNGGGPRWGLGLYWGVGRRGFWQSVQGKGDKEKVIVVLLLEDS